MNSELQTRSFNHRGGKKKSMSGSRLYYVVAEVGKLFTAQSLYIFIFTEIFSSSDFTGIIANFLLIHHLPKHNISVKFLSISSFGNYCNNYRVV